jgi:hypothetical protein
MSANRFAALLGDANDEPVKQDKGSAPRENNRVAANPSNARATKSVDAPMRNVNENLVDRTKEPRHNKKGGSTDKKSAGNNARSAGGRSGREFDRHVSGTGRGKEMKRNGGGPNNWGEATATAEGAAADVEDGGADGAVAEEPEVPTKSFSDYLKEMEDQRAALPKAAAVGNVSVAAADPAWKKTTVLEKEEEAVFMLLKPEGTKKKRAHRERNMPEVVPVNLAAFNEKAILSATEVRERQDRGERTTRGGRGGSVRGAAPRGGRGGASFSMDARSFPSL